MIKSVVGRFVLCFCAAFSSFTLNAQAPRHHGPFQVKLEGLRNEVEALKIKAELQAARDTRYCRGAKIPAPKAAWECQGVGPGVERCEREYHCARIRADLSRLTETRKLLKKQKERGLPNGEHKISFSPPPGLPAVNWPMVKPGPRRTEVSEIRSEQLQEIKLPRSEQQNPQAREPIAAAPKISERSSTREDELDLAALMDETDETPMEEDPKTPGLRKLDWKNFALTWVRASNEFSETQANFDMSWTPYYKLSDTWGLRGQLGAHTYEVEGLEEVESFLVIDMFGHLQFNLWQDIVLEAGAGLQRWNSEEAGSLTGFSFGGAYFVNWGLVERLTLHSVSLSGSDDISIGELRFGLGTSF